MLKFILPKGKDEYILIVSLVLFYFIYSYPFIFNTSITDSIEYSADTYFSFDTPSYYHLGCTYISAHPLILLFTYPILFISKILILLTDDYKSKTVFISLFCNLLISSSCIYIYKYSKQIISLSKIKSLLITGIFAVFSTNLILSFTIESFTLSAFFLSFSLYYYSSIIKNKKSVPLYACIALSLILGGITITNFPIALIPIIFTNDTLIKKIKKITIPSVIIIISILIIKSLSHLERFDRMGISKRFSAFTLDNDSNF